MVILPALSLSLCVTRESAIAGVPVVCFVVESIVKVYVLVFAYMPMFMFDRLKGSWNNVPVFHTFGSFIHYLWKCPL